jgi:hypothetical protein
VNTGILILRDGTPCIIYDGDVPHVRNVEFDYDGYLITLVWVSPETGEEGRLELEYPLSDNMLAGISKYEIIGIGRITPEKKLEDLHMIPVVFLNRP